MKKKRRELEVFSLSFLDCICCGFGAIILLFVLSMGEMKKDLKVTEKEANDILQQRLAQLGYQRKEKERVTGELAAREKSLKDVLTELADLQALIATLKEKIQNGEGGKKALLTENEQLKAEIAAMQKETDIPQLNASTPIGVPVDSNYVAFVIDTSGSMRDPNTEMLWAPVLRKFEEVINAYPIVKGVQFLDADGRFILGSRNAWLPDSPEQRQSMLQSIRRYHIFSNSNPVPGIVRAIKTLHDPKDPDMKMGIYVFGDEFTETADNVIKDIDHMNAPDENGKRPVTINGVGFPTGAWAVAFGLGQTGLKFANLLRELTQRNGGAFIAVTVDWNER